MKTLFLTSEIGASEKIDGVRRPVKLENTNNFLQNFMESFKSHELALFFTSNPTTFESNDKYAENIQKSFKMSGIEFEDNIVVDDRTADIKELIAKADLIYLMGGQTLVQNKFFEKIQLRELLKNYDGVVLGESAGAINMANIAYESRESLDEESHWFRGLELTTYNIEPHFSELNKELIDLTLKPDSKKAPFIALENRSYIMIKDGSATLYGNAWKFSNGDYNLINKKDEQKRLDKEESRTSKTFGDK